MSVSPDPPSVETVCVMSARLVGVEQIGHYSIESVQFAPQSADPPGRILV